MVTLSSPPIEHGSPERIDETPISLNQRLTGMDRAFRGLLAGSGVIVLIVLVSIIVFLFSYSWWALKTFHIHFFTETVWSAPLHPGVLGILVGSVLIALIAVAFGTPIALAIALMINEYTPPWLRGWLTGLVDLLAVIPSIVFGFWGLEVLNRQVQGPVSWIADHLGFIPIFRTTEPGTYTDSVFVCGLVVGIMIIPVVASVSREVMSQAPRDACEGALGLGGRAGERSPTSSCPSRAVASWAECCWRSAVRWARRWPSCSSSRRRTWSRRPFWGPMRTAMWRGRSPSIFPSPTPTARVS